MNEQDDAQTAAASLRTPCQPVYYYESTHQKRWRLLYCINREELERRVRQWRTSAQILSDYPDGIDVDVSEASFAQLNSSYALRLAVPADWLLWAFGEICRRSGLFVGSGYIAAQPLERLAYRISHELSALELLHKGDAQQTPSALPSLDTRREMQASRAERIAMMHKYLAGIRIPKVRAGLQLSKQRICKVEFAGDVDSSMVFNTLYSGQGKGHGYKQ